ncbi:MAG TPA: VWA domain-containing protein [Pyrinomonadaceae bacterium]|nr:VWA domain-containing protein [Pyrinomonadaceae bacterium]
MASTLSAQQPNPAATTGAGSTAGPTIQLSLIVTDAKNKSLNAIKKADVRLIEDKVEQTVLSVEPDERPVDCGIVIDASGSFRRLIASTIEAAGNIVANRRPTDEIFIERFISSDKIQKLQDFTSEEQPLLDALKLIKIEGGQSAVIDAIYTAAQYTADHKRNTDRRKALVVFTDGEDRNSFYNREKLLALLHQENVQVFVVGLIVDLNNEAGLVRASPRERAQKLLNSIAEQTGGRVFYPKDKPELIAAVVQIIHDLHGQFRITYQSSNSGKKDLREVEVKLALPPGEKRNAIVPRSYQVEKRTRQ